MLRAIARNLLTNSQVGRQQSMSGVHMMVGCSIYSHDARSYSGAAPGVSISNTAPPGPPRPRPCCAGTRIIQMCEVRRLVPCLLVHRALTDVSTLLNISAAMQWSPGLCWHLRQCSRNLSNLCVCDCLNNRCTQLLIMIATHSIYESNFGSL